MHTHIHIWTGFENQQYSPYFPYYTLLLLVTGRVGLLVSVGHTHTHTHTVSTVLLLLFLLLLLLFGFSATRGG